MYYIEQNNKILAYNEILADLQAAIEFKPELAELEIKETDRPIIDFEFADTAEYQEEQANKRQQAFLKDFFNVNGYGYYRRVPKGYQSAVESMNVLFNIANLTKGLQAGLIIFYEEPDFTKPEECTEKWLVEHQIIMPAMTLEEFMQLYVAFMTAWNTTEH